MGNRQQDPFPFASEERQSRKQDHTVLTSPVHIQEGEIMCYFTAGAGTVGTSKSNLLQSPSYGSLECEGGAGALQSAPAAP